IPLSEILHDQVRLTIHGAEIIDGRDIGMRDPGHQLRLAAEPGDLITGVGGSRHGDEFDRDLPAERQLPGQDDHTHAASDDRPEDFIAWDLLAVLREFIGHVHDLLPAAIPYYAYSLDFSPRPHTY